MRRAADNKALGSPEGAAAWQPEDDEKASTGSQVPRLDNAWRALMYKQ
jgi:hypothetical protein